MTRFGHLWDRILVIPVMNDNFIIETSGRKTVSITVHKDPGRFDSLNVVRTMQPPMMQVYNNKFLSVLTNL
jgi:hypothetical protein